MKRKMTHLFTENFSYKVVALFISLILWLTILGRRDFVMSKNIEIDLITSPGQAVVAQTTDQIKVKVSGPRTALKNSWTALIRNLWQLTFPIAAMVC